MEINRREACAMLGAAAIAPTALAEEAPPEPLLQQWERLTPAGWIPHEFDDFRPGHVIRRAGRLWPGNTDEPMLVTSMPAALDGPELGQVQCMPAPAWAMATTGGGGAISLEPPL